MAENNLTYFFPLMENPNPSKCYVSQAALEELANERMTGEEMRVFFKLLSVVGSGNRLIVCQKKLAGEMGIHPSSFSKAMKGLCERNIIVRDERDGVSGIYMFNPRIVRTDGNHRKITNEFKELLEKRNTANK